MNQPMDTAYDDLERRGFRQEYVSPDDTTRIYSLNLVTNGAFDAVLVTVDVPKRTGVFTWRWADRAAYLTSGHVDLLNSRDVDEALDSIKTGGSALLAALAASANTFDHVRHYNGSGAVPLALPVDVYPILHFGFDRDETIKWGEHDAQAFIAYYGDGARLADNQVHTYTFVGVPKDKLADGKLYAYLGLVHVRRDALKLTGRQIQ